MISGSLPIPRLTERDESATDLSKLAPSTDSQLSGLPEPTLSESSDDRDRENSAGLSSHSEGDVSLSIP